MRITLLVLLVLFFYFGVSTQWTYNFKKEHYSGHFYWHLTNAFEKGQLESLEKPNPDFLKLKNPYNPSENGRIKIHDFSYYKNKYYIYFGATPVILLYLPYKLITKQNLHEEIPGFIFGMISFLFSVGIINRIKQTYFNNINKKLYYLSIITLGLGNINCFLMQKVDAYQISILCANAFFLGSIYFMIKHFTSKGLSTIEIIIYSTFLGLAICSKQTYCVSSFVIFFIFVKCLLKSKKDFICFILPFLTVMILLGFYNFLRFENPFESGIKYQLTVADNTKVLLSGDFIPENIYHNFLEPPMLNGTFPFIHLTQAIPPFVESSSILWLEKTAGMLTSFPITLIFIIAPILLFDFLKPKEKDFPIKEYAIISTTTLINTLIVISFYATSLRYEGDILNLLLLPSFFVWFYLLKEFQSKKKVKIVITSLFIVFCIISIFSGIAYGIEGADNYLFSKNPSGYEFLKNIILPVYFILTLISVLL